jgi:hypothetical protein
LLLRRKFFGVTDFFALFGEARRPWLDPEKLKERYFARARARLADAELNEAFRVLSDPRWRLRHFLQLEGADLNAGRDVPPVLADLFWNSGMLLREIDRWISQNAAAPSALTRALLSGERAQLETRLKDLEQRLTSTYETEVMHLREAKISEPISPNELKELVQRHDALSYLTRLREQAHEKSFQLHDA